MTVQPTTESRPVPLPPRPPLSREEALQVAESGFGSRPDLPPGTEFVRKSRTIWRGLKPSG